MLTKREKVFAAGLSSALLHAMLLVAAAYIVSLNPHAPNLPAPRPIHLELVRSEPAMATPAPTPEKPVLDNSKMTEVEHPNPKAKFEGDRNTAAASELPATGDKPLPTQLGREAPRYVFDPSPPAPDAKPSEAKSKPLDPPVTAPPRPEPNRPVSRTPARQTALVLDDHTMLDTEPTPPPEELNPYDPSFRSTAPPPPTPVRAAARPAAYRPMDERTATSGDISTRGTSSVDAIATPYGRYRKQVLDSIRQVWTASIHARGDLASLGTVKFHFAIDRSGHVHAPRMLTNTSNEALASITQEAISKAPIPPIPPEVVETMNSAMLQLDVSFECL